MADSVLFFRVLHTMFFDLCEGGCRIADLESGRARDMHASTVTRALLRLERTMNLLCH